MLVALECAVDLAHAHAHSHVLVADDPQPPELGAEPGVNCPALDDALPLRRRDRFLELPAGETVD